MKKMTLAILFSLAAAMVAGSAFAGNPAQQAPEEEQVVVDPAPEQEQDQAQDTAEQEGDSPEQEGSEDQAAE